METAGGGSVDDQVVYTLNTTRFTLQCVCLSIRSVENINKFCHHLKLILTTLFSSHSHLLTTEILHMEFEIIQSFCFNTSLSFVSKGLVGDINCCIIIMMYVRTCLFVV